MALYSKVVKMQDKKNTIDEIQGRLQYIYFDDLKDII